MTKIATSGQIREADAFTIENEPIASIDLMLRAAEQLRNNIINRYTKNSSFQLFCGPGNNGGDGFALAILLLESGYQVEVFHPKAELLSDDAAYYFQRLKHTSIPCLDYSRNVLDIFIHPDAILVDALFGTGLSRKLDGDYAILVDLMNQSGNSIISVDIPSGLFCEDNSGNDLESVIHASLTLSFQFPKLAFFFPEHAAILGDWEILPIGIHPEFIESMHTQFHLLTPEFLRTRLHNRKRFDHKGIFGHGFLVAGSYGKMGAAILAGKACLRSGVGLLTIHVPRFGYDIIQNTLPEAMASIDKYDKLISKIPGCDGYTAVGIGPGIGKSMYTYQALKDLFQRSTCPLVIDADAINLLAEHQELLDIMPQGCVLTPHFKEFERLVGPSANHYVRLQKQIEFAGKYQVVVVLKGARTSIVSPDGTCYLNMTGNPGMAKGGSGDVLTGIVLSFLAQGYSAQDAAMLAVYLHGLAGDFGKAEYGEEALLPGDTINMLGKSFKSLKGI